MASNLSRNIKEMTNNDFLTRETGSIAILLSSIIHLSSVYFCIHHKKFDRSVALKLTFVTGPLSLKNTYQQLTFLKFAFKQFLQRTIRNMYQFAPLNKF